MRRLFLVLAAIAGLLLVADLVARAGWSSADLSWFSIPAALVVHASVFEYLRATGRRVAQTASQRGWADWVSAQAEKNRRKAWVAEVGGLPLAAVAAWPGQDLGPLALFAACVAFQLGAFVAEGVILQAQARLLAEVAGWPRESKPGWIDDRATIPASLKI